MKKKVLYILPIHESGMNRLRENFEVIVSKDAEKETVMALIPDVHAIITRLCVIDADIINAGKNLKAIAKHGVGVDNIDVKTATDQGIVVLTTGDVNSLTVAEHVVFALGAMAKRISYFDRQMHENNWKSREPEGSTDLYGKTLGIIGYGKIGTYVAAMARNGFGMKLIVYARYPHKREIEEKGYIYTNDLDWLCQEADAISIHVPLSEETQDLFDERRLSLMKPTSYLINFARGGIVNEKALYDALSNKKIMGAALDVFEKEPPEEDSPLLKLDNVLLSPHVAYATADARMRMSMQVAEGIEDVLNGRIPKFAANKNLF